MRIEQSLLVQAPVESLWPLLAETEKLNREVGLPAIQFRRTPNPLGGSDAFAEVRVAGQTLRYEERPFEWLQGRFYHVRRVFDYGPVREVVGGVRLSPEAGGTRVLVWAEAEPRSALGAPLARAVAKRGVSDVARACEGFAAYLAQRSATPYPKHSGKPPADERRLESAMGSLADSPSLQALRKHLVQAPPEELQAMRPFDLADRFGLDRREMLVACLSAAKAGILELRWSLLCPSCRGGPPGLRSLRELATGLHCESCNISFDADFDRSVEVTFNVARAIRDIPATIYCIGGPERTPHIAMQLVLEPGETRQMPIELPEGRYELMSPQSATRTFIDIRQDGEPEGTFSIMPDRQITTSATGLTPGASLSLANNSTARIVVRLVVAAWAVNSASAALVTSMPEFRDSFSSEVLAPDVEIGVHHICILFSDLRGSTAMYGERGDAPSYRAVRDHFAFMHNLIAAHRGTIVKTIGDAVMAAFYEPADALRAALAIQREEGELVVKLGLHWGPALAVNANDVLDYFGQTVNLAARLQRESAGCDVVLSAELAGDARVLEVIAAEGVKPEPFEADLKGIGKVQMLRLAVERT